MGEVQPGKNTLNDLALVFCRVHRLIATWQSSSADDRLRRRLSADEHLSRGSEQELSAPIKQIDSAILLESAFLLEDESRAILARAPSNPRINKIGVLMNIKGSTVIIAALALVCLSCGSQPTNRSGDSQPRSAVSPTSAAVDELAAANEHYQKHCLACHGEKGDGGKKTIEGTTLNVASLREGHAVEHSDQELVKQILDGGDGMPAFKDKLSTKEAADLIKYVRREFQGK
jgi:hypothetical protein